MYQVPTARRIALTAALAHDGATIYAGHDTANVAGADAVIISSAVKPNQVEFMAARAAGIPVYKRSDIMADLMTGKQVIAVAGTAGKTTTTAMITHILIETGNDPSYIIGGVLSTTEQNAAVGAGDAFVIEADEYDNMFLGLRPNVAVVTNIAWDHPDFFKTPADLQRSFEQFVDLLPEGGTLVVNVDTPGAAQLQNRLPLTISYGLRSGQWAVRTTYSDETGLRFDVWHGERLVGQGHLQVPGVHNALNALAAILATGIVGVNFAEAVQALASFKGAGRRFELKGEIDGVAVIDDYAHHPLKIRAALEAARSRYPDRQIWAVWQPHTYSRTQVLWDDFLHAFADADHVLITDIYAAREQPIEGVTGMAIAAAMDHPDARFVASFDAAVALLDAEVTSPAAILIMSAGDAPQIGIGVLEEKIKCLTQRRKDTKTQRDAGCSKHPAIGNQAC